LATVLFLRGQTETAMEHLIQIVKRDREWEEDKARLQLVKFFEALGPKDPATLKGRRMLSTVLFR
jgi:putative thioredoxin